MSKRTIATIAAGIVATGVAAADVWTGANGWATAGIAAVTGITAAGATWFVWGKIAGKFG